MNRFISRRSIVRGAAAAVAVAGAPLLVRRGARAELGVGPARHLVIVMAGGGWDTTYALDPKPSAPYVDTPEGIDALRGDLRWWSSPERPAVDRFFERWGDIACIVNGIQVRSFVHSDCMKRILTGGPSETAPDLGAIAAFELGRDLPVPYLALGAFARSGEFGALTGRSGTTNQLVALIDPDASYADLAGRLETGVVPTEDEDGVVRRFLDASAERFRATRGSRGYNRRRVDDFVSSLDRADRLAVFGGGGALGERDFTQNLDVQVPLAVRALREGLSHVAYLQSDNWDTHTANAGQSYRHERLYATLDSLALELETQGVLEDTLVAVVSEMGRTPRLNAEQGKDHWPVTSAVLFGAGVRGGRVIGGTSDQLEALSIDLRTGAPSEQGTQLQTSNLIAGILGGVGVDPSSYLPGSEAFCAYRV